VDEKYLDYMEEFGIDADTSDEMVDVVKKILRL